MRHGTCDTHSGEGLAARTHCAHAQRRGCAYCPFGNARGDRHCGCCAQAAVRSCAELKETLLHKHEAHTALRTELKRAQVRL